MGNKSSIMNKEEGVNSSFEEPIRNIPGKTTKFICEVCGEGFDDGNLLDSHIAKAHHPKRTITVNDIVSIVFNGNINLPKTKAEIVREAERNKDNKPEITPEIIDTLRNLPDKRYNDQADLTAGIQNATTVQ